MKRQTSRAIFTVSTVAQAGLVYAWFAQSISWYGVFVLILLTGLLLPAWQHRRKIRFAENILATLSFGGFGMILGRYFDTYLANTTMAHHAHHHATNTNSLLEHAAGFEFLLMFVFCLIGCELICGINCFSAQRKQRIFCKSSGHIMMAIGMLAGGTLAAMRPGSSAAFMYFAMWAGMGIGAWVGLSLARQLMRGIAVTQLLSNQRIKPH